MGRRTKTGDAKVAIGYVRVSTDEQRLGPKAQAAALDAWAAREGVQLVAVFVDHGESGATPIDERAGLCGALAALRDASAGVLVAAKRDRLARDLGIASTLAALARGAGAVVRTADGASDGAEDDESATMRRGIEDVFAAVERLRIRNRTRAALAVKKARGERVGSVPFGFRLAADGATLERDEREHAIVDRVRELHATGLSERAIVARLAAEGVTSRAGRPLGRTQVQRIVSPSARERRKAA